MCKVCIPSSSVAHTITPRLTPPLISEYVSYFLNNFIPEEFFYLLCRHEIKPLFPTFCEYLRIIHNFSSSPFKVTVNCHSKQNTKHYRANCCCLSHNGLPFSTFDVDNDNREGDFAERSCARLYKVRYNSHFHIQVMHIHKCVWGFLVSYFIIFPVI